MFSCGGYGTCCKDVPPNKAPESPPMSGRARRGSSPRCLPLSNICSRHTPNSVRTKLLHCSRCWGRGGGQRRGKPISHGARCAPKVPGQERAGGGGLKERAPTKCDMLLSALALAGVCNHHSFWIGAQGGGGWRAVGGRRRGGGRNGCPTHAPTHPPTHPNSPPPPMGGGGLTQSYDAQNGTRRTRALQTCLKSTPDQSLYSEATTQSATLKCPL